MKLALIDIRNLPRCLRYGCGGTLIAAGLVLAGWSFGLFFRAHGTPMPLKPPQELVTNGPFAVTRNPIVTGMFMAAAGLGLIADSAVLLGSIPVAALLLRLELRYIEEPELERRFGEAYRQYRQQVPAFFPRMR